jgi:hypothetical protein
MKVKKYLKQQDYSQILKFNKIDIKQNEQLTFN